MSFPDGLSIEVEDGVGVLTMSNPGRRNAFYQEMRERMRGAITAFATDPAVRAIILTGADGHFCAGADLKRVGNEPPPTVLRTRERMRLVNALLTAIVAGPKPVIAAVEGDAFGAGMSMAVAADVVVAARGARFGASFARIGLFPDMGLMHTLPQRVGLPRARRLLMTAAPVGAEEAVEIGLADELCEAGGALARAREIARELAASAPLSLAMIKSAFAKGVDNLDAAVQLELDLVPLLAMSEDHKAALEGFLQKKPVTFVGA